MRVNMGETRSPQVPAPQMEEGTTLLGRDLGSQVLVEAGQLEAEAAIFIAESVAAMNPWTGARVVDESRRWATGDWVCPPPVGALKGWRHHRGRPWLRILQLRSSTVPPAIRSKRATSSGPVRP